MRDISAQTKKAANKMPFFHLTTEHQTGEGHSVSIYAVGSNNLEGDPDSFIVFNLYDSTFDETCASQHLRIEDAEKIIKALQRAVKQVRKLDEIEAANR